MRFLLYNIRYGAGIGRQFHLPVPYSGYMKDTSENLKQIAGFIRSVHPDMVGLIEVDCGSFRSGQSNQAEEIARRLDNFSVYDETKYSQTSVLQKVPVLNKQCNAFLTNLPVASQKFHYMKEGVKRLVIEIELQGFSVFLVHLSLKFIPRHLQLQELYSIICKVRKPVIVAGDFNCFRGERELKLFMAALDLVNANNEGFPSHPSRSPRRQLDFILHSGAIKTRDFQIPRIQYSDHAPLVWDFEL